MAKSDLERCAERIAARTTLGTKGALKLLQEVADRADEMRRTGQSDPVVTAAHDLASRKLEGARLDRIDALRNAAKREVLKRPMVSLKATDRELRDSLHGSNVGHRDNVQTSWQSTRDGWLAPMTWQIKKEGLQPAAISGALDLETRRAMWKLSGWAGDVGQVSEPAAKLAEIYGKPLDQARDAQNAEGARIGKDPSYTVHQWHDPRLMRNGGRDAPHITDRDEAFKAWWEFSKPLARPETFADVTPKEGETTEQAIDRFGRSFYDATESGVHMTTRGASGLPIDEAGYIAPTFEGTRNLARRVSQDKVWLFASPEAEHAYMQRYGRFPTLLDAATVQLDQSARNVALMRRFGTNPEANLNQIIRWAEEKYRDQPGLDKFRGQAERIRKIMGLLDGSANRPENEMIQSLGQTARSYYNTVYLGSVGLTHFASVWPTVTTELRHHGIGAFGGLGNIAKVAGYLFKGLEPAELRAVSHDLGAYSDALAYSFARNWNIMFEPGETIPGRVAAFHANFMTATGIRYIFDSVRAGVRETLAANLGRQMGSEYGGLHPLLQNILGKYRIGPDEWNILRAIPDVTSWSDRKYLTPGDTLKADAGQIEGLLRARGEIGEGATPETIAAKVDYFRHQLADRIGMYYADAAAHSVVQPGVRERAALYGWAGRPGTVGNEMFKLLMQFKIWPLAVVNQVIGREIHMSLSAKGAAWGIGLAVGLSALAGYTRMAVNDAASGRPQRDPMNPMNLVAGLAQGGGLGIFGDFLFGETSRMGAGIVATAAGPLGTDWNEILKVFQTWKASMRTGEKYNAWPEVARFAVHHVPLQNLFYLKGALNYLLWYHLYESASPGWWERTNRRLIKEQGRPMAGYVPGGQIPHMPWAVGSPTYQGVQ